MAKQTTTPPRRARLFVYGTLRPGASHAQLLGDAKHLGEVRTLPLFTLLSLGWYPAMCAGGSSVIHGDLYEVSTEQWAVLDEYEDCPTLYRCEEIDLQDEQRAYAYVLNTSPPADATVISSGDWHAHVHATRVDT